MLLGRLTWDDVIHPRSHVYAYLTDMLCEPIDLRPEVSGDDLSQLASEYKAATSEAEEEAVFQKLVGMVTVGSS